MCTFGSTFQIAGIHFWDEILTPKTKLFQFAKIYTKDLQLTISYKILYSNIFRKNSCPNPI